MDIDLRKQYFSALEKELEELINPKTGLLDEKYSKIINCPLCGSKPDRHRQLFIKNGYTFARCDDCELIFSNPQVNLELLNELYGKSKANDLWVEIQESEKEKSWKKEYYLDCLRLLEKTVKKDNPKLLDIGCSTGYFLELVREHKPKWDEGGLEPSGKAYEYAVKKGLDVKKLFLNQVDREQKQDIFTMFGVLEHLPNPKNILEDIKKYSADESFVLAIVPNAYSLYHMFIQGKSVGFDGRNHLLYFSEKTLRKLFEDNGFDVLFLDTVLTGLDNIKRQIQWFDPNDNLNKSERFIPEKIRYIFQNGIIENIIYRHNLGLRLRILTKWQKK